MITLISAPSVSPDGSTGRNAHQHTFLATDQPTGGKGVVVLHGNDLVINLGVQHVRHKACGMAAN